MPWFITSTSVKDTSNINPYSNPIVSRTFGFYEHYNDARNAVKENRGNMHECLYSYLVIEYIEEGIHQEALQELWYKYNIVLMRWEELKNKPPEFKWVSNFAMG